MRPIRLFPTRRTVARLFHTVNPTPNVAPSWNIPPTQSAMVVRRCIVPADAFYECKAVEGGKQPYAIARPDGQPMAFAGLWEGFRWPDGTATRSYTIVTTMPNAEMADLHNRMPVLLEPDDWPIWLGELEVEGKPCRNASPVARWHLANLASQQTGGQSREQRCMRPRTAKQTAAYYVLALVPVSSFRCVEQTAGREAHMRRPLAIAGGAGALLVTALVLTGCATAAQREAQQSAVVTHEAAAQLKTCTVAVYTPPTWTPAR